MDVRSLQRNMDVETPFMDVKSAFHREKLTEAGFKVWRL